MRKATRRWCLMFGLALTVTVIVPGVAYGQPAQPAPQPITGLEEEGELLAVDPDKRLFLVVGDDATEMLFYYDDQTEVGGQTEGVQGLTGEAGTWLRIQYRADGERAIAERIEIVTDPLGQADPSPPVEPDAEPPAEPDAEPTR